jgi:hypothetical protein
VSKQYALVLWAVAGAAFFLGAGGTLLLWAANEGLIGHGLVVLGFVYLPAVGGAVGSNAGMFWQSIVHNTKQPCDDTPLRG